MRDPMKALPVARRAEWATAAVYGTVLVLADRGLYARWLYKCILAQGWHPFLRINQGGQFRPLGNDRFRDEGAQKNRITRSESLKAWRPPNSPGDSA